MSNSAVGFKPSFFIQGPPYPVKVSESPLTVRSFCITFEPVKSACLLFARMQTFRLLNGLRENVYIISNIII